MATTTMAAKPPAPCRDDDASSRRLAAPATPTLARTFTHMPTYLDAADARAPVQNEDGECGEGLLPDAGVHLFLERPRAAMR